MSESSSVIVELTGQALITVLSDGFGLTTNNHISLCNSRRARKNKNKFIKIGPFKMFLGVYLKSSFIMKRPQNVKKLNKVH